MKNGRSTRIPRLHDLQPVDGAADRRLHFCRQIIRDAADAGHPEHDRHMVRAVIGVERRRILGRSVVLDKKRHRFAGCTEILGASVLEPFRGHHVSMHVVDALGRRQPGKTGRDGVAGRRQRPAIGKIDLAEQQALVLRDRQRVLAGDGERRVQQDGARRAELAFQLTQLTLGGCAKSGCLGRVAVEMDETGQAHTDRRCRYGSMPPSARKRSSQWM